MKQYIENIQNLSFFIILKRKFIKIRLRPKQSKNEANKTSNGIFKVKFPENTSINSNIKAPIVNGMNIKKENLAAFSLFIPRKEAEEIVIPLREIAGNNAKTWKSPIINEFLKFNVLFVIFTNFVESKTNPLSIKNKPINKKELDVFSIKSLKRKPNIPAGIIPIKTYQAVLSLNFKTSNISFLKKIITANNDAKCKKIVKNKFGVEIIKEVNAKCPSEETGRNSVNDWISASISSFNI